MPFFKTGKKEADLDLDILEMGAAPAGGASGGGGKRSKSAKSRAQVAQTATNHNNADPFGNGLVNLGPGFNPFEGAGAAEDGRKEEISYDWVSFMPILG